jgi:lipoprotein-anchoring transpeptidase ErfK/SrfK
MRTVIRLLLVVVGLAASVVAGPASVSTAAANQAHRLSGFTIASIAPSPGEIVGVAHPLVVTFADRVTDRAAAERALDVSSSVPRRGQSVTGQSVTGQSVTGQSVAGRFEWIDNRTVHWVADEFWPAHSTVALSVGGRPTTIATGPAVIGVANISDHTFTVTIDGIGAGPSSALPAPHHRPRWGEAGVFPASMGRPKYPTPVGIYTVLAKERGVTMDSSTVGIPVHSPDGYLLKVEHAVRFTRRGLFVHGAPWAVNSLGHDNVSHGCISLSPEDAEWYFDTVNVGDPIIVRENGLEVPRSVSAQVTSGVGGH